MSRSTKIATNVPLFLPRPIGYEIFQLGDRTGEASAIVLLLGKNWGGGSIDSIRALTHWVSAYPKDIPCYIIGCESTIPTKDLRKYLMKAREDVIRALCDEVLSRSKSIGVRGEITYLYLTEILGYREDQVDIIYNDDDSNNEEKLQDFLKKNGCSFRELEKSFLAFQGKPRIFYERPMTFDKVITIPPPYITSSEGNARLCADVLIDGQSKTIWCETADSYSDYLLSERADAFLCGLLPYAMRTGKDILCQVPVTEQFLHNLSEILIPHLCAHDTRLYPTKIIAPVDSSPLSSGGAVGTGMSCGVDSFYTVSMYKDSPFSSMNLTHLYTGNYLYGNDSEVYERAELVAKDLSLPLVRTATNLNEVLNLPHLFTHFFKTMFGVLALRKLFKIYYYSTAEDFSHFDLKNNSIKDTAIFELLLLYAFSCSDFQVVTGGAKSERVEKTRAVVAFPTAQKFLNVCLYPNRKLNCGKCAKCRRTLLTIDMLDSLEIFQGVFDTEEYQKTRLDSFVYLAQQKNSIMLSEVYQYFSRTEPLLIKQAEERLSKSALQPN